MAKLTPLLSLAGAAAAAAFLAGSGSTAAPQPTAPEKAALEQHATDVQAAARARAAFATKPADPALERPAPQVPGRPPTGLVELPSPFPAGEYLLGATAWQELSGDARVSVYAGEVEPAGSAVVLVVATDRDSGAARTVSAYTAPGAAGPLDLVTTDGHLLKLRDAAGRTVAFDLATRRFLAN